MLMPERHVSRWQILLFPILQSVYFFPTPAKKNDNFLLVSSPLEPIKFPGGKTCKYGDLQNIRPFVVSLSHESPQS